jgi:hypothetical protein
MIVGKLWAGSASPASITNTKLGCSLNKAGTTLDNSILDVPKVADHNGSAGIIALNAVIQLNARSVINITCADFDTQVNANNIVLTAIGG